ncbi:MAG TPA: HEAT repeat domain-containing protein, partial [Polyangiaceae bacterium]|nr:HEAT repeat domain-containing protein [Polyangiaceae bacterium]
MHWSRRSFLALVVLTVASHALAAPGLEELVEQLKHGADFRVRVAAALQLGKSVDPEASKPLEAALDDANASVRAAAAAALKNLGDVSALGPLRAHEDKSAAVKAQIASAIKSLEEDETSGPKTKVLVKIGIMKNGSGVKSPKIESELVDASRRKLNSMPGVKVLVEGALQNKPG